MLYGSYGAPRITKDGVTVAKETEDKFENMDAQMVREVASKSSESGRRFVRLSIKQKMAKRCWHNGFGFA
jgi:hypothetical protein